MLSREEREVWRLDEYWGDDNRSESGPASYHGSSHPEDQPTSRAWLSIPLNYRRTFGANLSAKESRQHCCGAPLRSMLPELTHWRCRHHKKCTTAHQHETLLHYLQRKRLRHGRSPSCAECEIYPQRKPSRPITAAPPSSRRVCPASRHWDAHYGASTALGALVRQPPPPIVRSPRRAL